MALIKTFNQAVSEAVNKEGAFYKVYIGQDPFTPESTIDESSDYNCGALCNELEFARAVSDYYIQSLDIDGAESDNLNAVVLGFINLPRRNAAETDVIYRKRFKFIVVEKTNYSRTTKHAILDAISYFIADMDTVQLIEPFDDFNLYFQIRFEGTTNYDDAIFLNNINQAFIGQNFIGGAGIGAVISYIGNLVDRIKAAGVDYDILFVSQDSITKTADAVIGSVQIYLTADTVIKAPVSFTKTADSEVIALSQPDVWSIEVTLHEPAIPNNTMLPAVLAIEFDLKNAKQFIIFPAGATLAVEGTIYAPSIGEGTGSQPAVVSIELTIPAPTIVV